MGGSIAGLGFMLFVWAAAVLSVRQQNEGHSMRSIESGNVRDKNIITIKGKGKGPGL